MNNLFIYVYVYKLCTNWIKSFETMRFRLDVTIEKRKSTPMLVLWVIISFPRKTWQVKVGYMNIWPIVLKN